MCVCVCVCVFVCGKNKNNENFKTTIPNNNYDRLKTTGECEMFLNICVAC